MTIYSGTIVAGGPLDPCKSAVLAIKTACEAEGWETIEYNTSDNYHHWVGRSTGISGTENIIVGVRSFVKAGPIYSISFFGFANYVVGTPFLSQATIIGNHLADYSKDYISFDVFNSPYRLLVNKQRVIWISVKTGDIVQCGYAGLFWRYATPSQYPLPLIARNPSGTGYSFASQDSDFHTGYLPGLTTVNFTIAPPFSDGGPVIRESDGIITLVPMQVVSNDVLGEMDGIVKITGDGLANRSVIQVGGSSVVDQTGMTDLEAAAAIEAVGGKAWLAFYSGSLRTTESAFAVRLD